MPSCHAAVIAGERRPPQAIAAGIIVLMIMWLALAVTPVKAAPPAQAGTPGGQGEKLFQAKCTSCHTIGQGKLVGPDLKDVTQRRDEQWLKSFIADPSKMFAANDPTATQLLRDNNGLKMPTLGLSAAEVDALVTYLRGASPTAAAGASGAAAVAGNAATGQRLFSGERRLQGGGPACISCHTAAGTGVLGGGALGPDLTHVAQRYGETGLAAALKNIAFPTMVGPFANRPLTAQEQADLVAFFKQIDQQQPPVPVISPGALTVNAWLTFAIGLAGTAVLFLILLFFWPRQRQSVSERLRNQGRERRA